MRHGFACGIFAALVACGPVDTTNGGAGAAGTTGGADGGNPGTGGAASIAIVSPADGATMAFADDHGDDRVRKVAVVVDLRGLHVAGDCGSDSSCGVLDAFVDDDRCGNPNGSANTGNQVTADFGRCGTVAGAHRLRAEIWRGSTLVARSNEIHLTVVEQDDHHDEGDDHGDDD